MSVGYTLVNRTTNSVLFVQEIGSDTLIEPLVKMLRETFHSRDSQGVECTERPPQVLSAPTSFLVSPCSRDSLTSSTFLSIAISTASP